MNINVERLPILKISKTLWNFIAIHLSLCVPECSDPTVLVNTMGGVCSGAIQTWCIWNNNEVAGLITTQIITEPWSKRKMLMIYTFQMNDKRFTIEDTAAIMDVLYEFARANECSRVVAYTRNRGVVHICKGLGWDTEQVVLSVEVPSGRGRESADGTGGGGHRVGASVEAENTEEVREDTILTRKQEEDN